MTGDVYTPALRDIYDGFGGMEVPDDQLGDNFEKISGHEIIKSTGISGVPHSYLSNYSQMRENLSYANFTMFPPPMPREMTFSSDNLMSVVAYCCLFVIAAIGNLTVFITLFRTRRLKSRVNCFIMHLSMADLIVTFIMLPLETAWHITVAWYAGEFACRLLMFCRAFGFYLSSFVLVTISLDRYFSIVHPLSLHDADKRGKLLLLFAWILSAAASLPQGSTQIQSGKRLHGKATPFRIPKRKIAPEDIYKKQLEVLEAELKNKELENKKLKLQISLLERMEREKDQMSAQEIMNSIMLG